MRGLKYLHPDARILAEKLLIECRKQNLNICITDTFRTKEEQNSLSSAVTDLKYPFSMHNWGLAFDFCKNSKTNAYDNSDGFFDKVGRIASQLGLEWGGYWDKEDKPHLQYNGHGNEKQLFKKYHTPENFKKTWKVTEMTKIIVDKKVIEVRSNNKDNQTYINLRDLEKAGFVIEYDEEAKMPVLITK